jgi:F420-non-reducing hydrogenase iron-sulfur subunit
MTTKTLVRPSLEWLPAQLKQHAKTKLMVFHCVNALEGISLPDIENCDIQGVQLPCSSMTREVVLLKAFEAGADAAVVLVCPVGACRYLEGNIRASKRVNRVKKMLDDIGLDGRRLNLYNVPHGDQAAVDGIIDKTLAILNEIGPSPAA